MNISIRFANSLRTVSHIIHTTLRLSARLYDAIYFLVGALTMPVRWLDVFVTSVVSHSWETHSNRRPSTHAHRHIWNCSFRWCKTTTNTYTPHRSANNADTVQCDWCAHHFLYSTHKLFKFLLTEQSKGNRNPMENTKNAFINIVMIYPFSWCFSFFFSSIFFFFLRYSFFMDTQKWTNEQTNERIYSASTA